MAGKKRNFFGIPKGQLAMMLAITDREDIDGIPSLRDKIAFNKRSTL